MTLVRKNQNERMPVFFDSFLLKNLGGWPEVNNGSRPVFTRPAVNIKEQENGFEVELAAPGLRKEDFSVVIDKNVLTISSVQNGLQEQEERKEKEKYSVREFSVSSFERSFSLPENTIDEEKVEASYQDGILRLQLPRKEEKKPTVKQIKIS